MNERKEKEMNEKVTISIEEITPEIAEQYLELNYKSNRPLKQVSVNQLARDMSEGKFILNPSAPIIFTEDGTLIDGQHRLWACVQCGCPFKTFVVRGADEKTYDVIDIGNTRSVADVIGGEYRVELQTLAKGTLATKIANTRIQQSHKGILGQTRKGGKYVSFLVSKLETVNEVKENRNELLEYARKGKRMQAVIRKWGVISYAYFQWLVKWVGKDDLLDEFTEEFCSVDSMNTTITTGRTLLLQRAAKKNVVTSSAWVIGALLTLYEAYLRGTPVKSFRGIENTLETWNEYVTEKRNELRGEENE